jgi:hypothetical protein
MFVLPSRGALPLPLSSLPVAVWLGLLSSLESPSTAHEEAQARALSELLTFITTHLETRHHHDHRQDTGTHRGTRLIG